MNKNLVFETKTYTKPSCPINLFSKVHSEKNPIKDLYTRHYHKEMEILCVTKGSLLVAIESRMVFLSAGDIIVIEPGLAHHTVKREDVEYTCVIFPVIPHIIDAYPEGCEIFLGKSGLTDKFLQNITRFPNIKEKCTNIIAEMIAAQIKNERGNLLLLRSGVQQLLFYTLKVLEEEPSARSEQNFNYSKILPAIEYINNNFHTKIPLNMLAELCHYNTFYFSRIFKYFLGMSVGEYINFERYKYAKMCLLESDATVSEIAVKSGFASENALYLYFKKTSGMTPNEFRTKNKTLKP